MRFLTGVILIVLFVSLALVSLTGCGKDKYVGKWEVTEMTFMGQTQQAPAGQKMDMEITKEKSDYYLLDPEKKEKVKLLSEDGKLVMREKNDTGGEITTTLTVDSTGILSIDLSANGQTMSMKCKKQLEK